MLEQTYVLFLCQHLQANLLKLLQLEAYLQGKGICWWVSVIYSK